MEVTGGSREWVPGTQQRVLQIEEGAHVPAGTPCGVQGWQRKGQERRGRVAKLSSAHLRARHTPPRVPPRKWAGALGYSFPVNRTERTHHHCRRWRCCAVQILRCSRQRACGDARRCTAMVLPGELRPSGLALAPARVEMLHPISILAMLCPPACHLMMPSASMKSGDNPNPIAISLPLHYTTTTTPTPQLPPARTRPSSSDVPFGDDKPNALRNCCGPVTMGDGGVSVDGGIMSQCLGDVRV